MFKITQLTLVLLTGGLLLLGILYDYLTLNEQIDQVNKLRGGR